MIATSRRQALGLFGAAAVTVPSIAAAIPDTDVAIIRAVNRLLDNEAALRRLGDMRLTIEDERRTDREYTALMARTNAIVDELERLGPPVTLAGVRAIARAALALGDAREDEDGCRIASDNGQWLALTALEGLIAI